MDTLDARWNRLADHAVITGPADQRRRPLALLFHGCGGVQAHLDDYAAAAVAAGWRAAIIDSYAPRGWSRAYGLGLVCTGVRFWGFERAGDVLASIHGLTRRDDVDSSNIVLAGWSHGGWAIMDLMTMALERPVEARVADAKPALLNGVTGLYLNYPYVGLGTRGGRRDWRYRPRVQGVIAASDHLGGPHLHERAYDRARAAGCAVQTVTVAGTHAFDQPQELLLNVSPMRRDPDLTLENLQRFGAFLRQGLSAQAA